MGHTLQTGCLIFENGIEIQCNEGHYYVDSPTDKRSIKIKKNQTNTSVPIVELVFKDSRWFELFKRFLNEENNWKLRFTKQFQKLKSHHGFWIWLGFVDYLHRHRNASLEGVAMIGLSRYANHFNAQTRLLAACLVRQSKQLLHIDIKAASKAANEAANLYRKEENKRGLRL